MILSALSVTPSPQVRGKATEALEALNKQGLISSLDDVKRSAAEAAHSLAAAEEKMKVRCRRLGCVNLFFAHIHLNVSAPFSSL